MNTYLYKAIYYTPHIDKQKDKKLGICFFSIDVDKLGIT